MITCDKKHLLQRCNERGYSWDEVQACIVSQDADTVTVDVDHPAYPRRSKDGFRPLLPQGRGPGSELKKLLAVIGIAATPDCSCNAKAAEMDRRGCRWCEENISTVVGWLREEAEKRGLPFLEIVAKLLVRRAIHNARKASPEDKMN